jgi:hypothetical protein
MKYPKVVLQLTLFMAFLFVGSVSAETHKDMASRYIEVSGIKSMLSSFPEQMDAMASQNQMTSRDPEAENRVYELMKESFDLERSEKELTDYLLQNTDKKFLSQLLKWLESPLARKITREEVRSSTPSEQANMLQYIAYLQEMPPTQERIALIQQLEETTRMSDLMTDIFMDIMKGMLESVNLALPEERRQGTDALFAEIMKIQPIMKNAFREQMIMTSFYTYRNISSRELGRYIQFYASETGQKEIRITGNALGYVLKQWFADVGRNLVLLEKGKAQGYDI